MKPVLASIFALLANAAAAQDLPDFAGKYRSADLPEAEFGCDTPIGPIHVETDRFHGIESDCLLLNPRHFPELNGILYTAECKSEGMTTTEPLMLMPSENGLYQIVPGWVVEWFRCP